jgi:DNA helicase-2/ATP-dependent DNA helicase PcrA
MENRIFERLSSLQKNIVFVCEGKFVVRACPGSGKTYSVAARLVQNLSTWQYDYKGIATLSFTNAAWQEIETQLSKHFGINEAISFPHFLGTIDSFLNKFIFLPFGHLIMKCKKRPVLVGEPHGGWTGYDFYQEHFTNMTFDINGDIYLINPAGVRKEDWNKRKYNFIRVKKQLLELGYATQADANYFAMRILEEYPQVCRTIVRRFPMVIIDEAQDTSDIQMKIIDLLVEYGLEHLMLVGDPDQAIFEWNEARPQLFIEKFQRWGKNSVILNENRRSSQKICDFSFRLSSLNTKSIAVTEEVKDFSLSPQIVPYNRQNLKDVVNSFLQTCRDYKIKINAKNVAILYRSKSLYEEITGIKIVQKKDLPWDIKKSPYTKEFAWGKYLFDKGERKKGFETIAKAIIKGLYRKNYCHQRLIEKLIDNKGFIYYAKRIYSIIKMMPETNSCIGEWVDQVNANFQKKQVRLTLYIKKSKRDMNFDDIFSIERLNIPEKNYRIGTIHSVKGETFEAVLVILKTKVRGNKTYRKIIEEKIQLQNNEELRIVYVGITRPRKLLALSVPEEDQQLWECKFQE